jgi:hypothetical protein
MVLVGSNERVGHVYARARVFRAAQPQAHHLRERRMARAEIELSPGLPSEAKVNHAFDRAGTDSSSPAASNAGSGYRIVEMGIL